MAVSVRTDPTFSLETPKMLFRGKYELPSSDFFSNWDIHPDGKRFLLIKRSATAGAAPAAAAPRHKINLVVNWFEELKQRVPVK
jgi:hypothetical protein